MHPIAIIALAVAAAAATGPALAAPIAPSFSDAVIDTHRPLGRSPARRPVSVPKPPPSGGQKPRRAVSQLESRPVARAEDDDESSAGKLADNADVTSIGSSILSAWQRFDSRDDAAELDARILHDAHRPVGRAPPSGGQKPPPSGGQRPRPRGGQSTRPSGGQSTRPSGGQSTRPSGGQKPPPSGGQKPRRSAFELGSLLARAFDEVLDARSLNELD